MPELETETELDKLHDAYYAANEAHRKIVSERDSRISDRITAFRRNVEAEMHEEYAAEIIAAYQTARIAEDAWNAEKERVALTGAGCEWPIGTVMVQWHREPWHSGPTYKQTGRVGQIEVITRESQHSGTRGQYGRANIGSVVIRLLKKDGTTASRYIMPEIDFSGTGRVRFHNWHPEGVDPNQEQK